MPNFNIGFKYIALSALVTLGISAYAPVYAQSQQGDKDSFVGVGVYGNGSSNNPSVVFSAPVGSKYSIEGSATTFLDYLVRANGYYHFNERIKVGLGAVHYKSGSFNDTGARISAGYGLVQTDKWQVNVLAGREFVLAESNFVELQLRYKFTDRLSVFYYSQYNSGYLKDEGNLGISYSF